MFPWIFSHTHTHACKYLHSQNTSTENACVLLYLNFVQKKSFGHVSPCVCIHLAPRRHLYLQNLQNKMLLNFHWFALVSAFKIQTFAWSMMIFSSERFHTNSFINKAQLFKWKPTNTDKRIVDCPDKFMDCPFWGRRIWINRHFAYHSTTTLPLT